MAIIAEIKKNPYLKIRNCTDVADCNSGIEECRRLEDLHGRSKTLDRIWIGLINKKNRLKK